MKVKHFKHSEDYHFLLIFANGEVKIVDPASEVAKSNVDIEPKTLYHFAQTQLSLNSSWRVILTIPTK